MKHINKLVIIIFALSILSACSMEPMMNLSRQPNQNNEQITKDFNQIEGNSHNIHQEPRVVGDKVIYNLSAQESKQEIALGKQLNLFTYNGTVPGQEIRVKVGQQVEVNLKNLLDEPITIHWHGYPVPIEMDGVPSVTQNGIEPGDTFQYSFMATVSGTYWYHSHYDSATQVDRGLYGAFIVEDEEDYKLDRDYTFVLDEMSSKGKVGKSIEMGMMGGSIYDIFTVNGRSGELIPAYEIDTNEIVRLRFINAGYKTHYMYLGPIQYKVVAMDGQSINQPKLVENQLLAIGPGERYDVEFTVPDGSFDMRDMLNDPAAEGLVIPMKNTTSEKILLEKPHNGILSLIDSGIVNSDQSLASSSFDLNYKMVLSHGMKGMGMVYTINGKVYPNIDSLKVKEGDIVKVTLENVDPMFDHPMHLHGHFFEILSKNGKRLNDSIILKDTLVVKPGENYEIAFIANNPGEWMFHCHDLNHASLGMTTTLQYEEYEIPNHIDQSQQGH